MTTALAKPDDLTLRSYIIYSLVFHAVISGAIFTTSYLERRGMPWGGVGDPLSGTRVSLVSAPAAGIPMPREANVTDSRTVDPAKTLHKEEPPKPPEPKTNETKIPDFKKEQRSAPSPKSRILENKTKEQNNAIPGHDGGAALPTGMAQSPGGGGPSGVNVQGQGGADFAARYSWYIDAAKRRVQPNWNVLMLDPAVRNGSIVCTVSFTILRDGSIKGLRVAQSSGNSSLDNSGLRAIQSSVPFPPLPNDWGPPDVFVLWDFPERTRPQ